MWRVETDKWKSLACLSSTAQIWQARTRIGKFPYTGVARGTSTSCSHASRVLRGFDSPERGGGDTIIPGVARGTCRSCSHAHRARCRSDSPEEGRVDSITSGVTRRRSGSHSHTSRTWRRSNSPNPRMGRHHCMLRCETNKCKSFAYFSSMAPIRQPRTKRMVRLHYMWRRETDKCKSLAYFSSMVHVRQP